MMPVSSANTAEKPNNGCRINTLKSCLGEYYMKKIIAVLICVFFVLGGVNISFASGSVYEHDPRLNPKAMEDIIVDPGAVCGFSPSPDGSLAPYAKYDWTDKEAVEGYKQSRLEYLGANTAMYEMLDEMTAQGKSAEEIARAISAKRNELRIASYDGNPDGLATLKERNLLKYGHEDGPTPDELFVQYGSWEAVTEKAFSQNPGMDACVGIYDDYYEYYIHFGYIEDENLAPASREFAAASFIEAAGTEEGDRENAFADFEEIKPWFKKSLEKAVSSGILKGYEDNTLKPQKVINRAEALVILSRCLPGLTAIREPKEFTDTPEWAKADITRLSGAGLVEGYENGLIGAYDVLTVRQVRDLVIRLKSR